MSDALTVSPARIHLPQFAASVSSLSPVGFSAQDHSTSEQLRTL
jgi:hypothetical protein